MFAMDNTKTQDDSIPIPEGLPSGVIVSADTRRPNRIPPGQSRTKKWPILDASGPPDIDESTWSLSLSGLIAQPKQWNWQQWHQLPQTRVFSDFHCVTRWSRLGNLWEGVATRVLVDLAGGLLPQARFALIRGFDGGWTTNVPVAAFLAEDCLIATLHDGEPLSAGAWRSGAADHPQPVRLEERQVGCLHRISRERQSRLLGEERLSHARRSVERRALWLVVATGLSRIWRLPFTSPARRPPAIGSNTAGTGSASSCRLRSARSPISGRIPGSMPPGLGTARSW